MHTRWQRALFLISMIVLFCACSKNLRETSLANPDAVYRLVIAGDSSEFKDRIRERLIQNYRDISHIDIVNLDKLEQIDPDDYQAVLIMDTCMAWGGFNREVTRFIDANEGSGNIVVFFTVGDPEWVYSYKGVDAITSASIPALEDEKVDELTRTIDLLLSGSR